MVMTRAPREWRALLGSSADAAKAKGRPKLSALGIKVNPALNRDGITTARKKPSFRFNFKQEGSIREVLSLNALNIDEMTLEVNGINEALMILEPGLIWEKEQRNIFEPDRVRQFKSPKQDWRMLYLYSRLHCLANPSNSELARMNIQNKLRTLGMEADGSTSNWLEQTTPLSLQGVLVDTEHFRTFHSKTVKVHPSQRTFRKKLADRVKQSKLIFMGVDSSSGKDTRQGEGSSNLPSDSLHYPHRKRSVSARFWKYVRHKTRLIQARLQHQVHSRRSLRPDNINSRLP